MKNLAMAAKLAKGKLVDVSRLPRTPEGDYVFGLKSDINFRDNVDYADCQKEEWIYSIGVRRTDKMVLASTTNKFYGNDHFDCIWLR